jgi:hypothetical protein
MKKPNDTYLGVYIPRSHFKQLKKKALAEDRSISALLRMMIAQSVGADNVKKAS